MILKFDFESSEPLYMQIRNQIVLGIGEGRLKPGEKLPPSGPWPRNPASI